MLGPGAADSDRQELQEAEANVEGVLASIKDLEQEMMAAAGLTEEMIQVIEAERQRKWLDPVDRSQRGTVTGEQVETTDLAEDVLPSALEALLARVDRVWLREQTALGCRLGAQFLSEPLSILRGIRIASEVRPIHRFAQMLLVAEDFLEERLDYDRFSGALLIPQTAALGSRIGDLTQVAGEVNERVEALWRLPSTMTDSTVYELLVAATSARLGRRVEFLEAGRAGTGVKIPDLRLHDYSFPFVIECKRKQLVTEADFDEEARMRALFAELRIECLRRGLFGLFKVRFEVEPEAIPIRAVVEAAVQQRLTPHPERYTAYGWGRIAYHPLPSVLDTPVTPLYSPLFLQRVFGWDSDLPPQDGLICQVDQTGEMLVDRVRAPLGFVWTNESPTVFRRRARTAAALFASAIRQIPAGEMGAVYICYQEGDREQVADDRVEYLRQQMRGWEHSSNIRVPLIVMSRIVPRALDHGRPDLVETAMPFVSELTGGSVWIEDLPTTVFTTSRRHRVAAERIGPAQ
ncbi:MAG TPA: hypothetical protein VHG28_20055 [Longimicrobiaceae bacterium]|nr:hypothetical protein [Longimicrobiaceae bacterium]